MGEQRIIKSHTDVDYAMLLMQIEEVARKAGIDLRYENLDDEDVNIESGLCYIRKLPALIIDKRLDLKGKLEIIAKELSGVDTDSIYKPPLIRQLIEPVER